MNKYGMRWKCAIGRNSCAPPIINAKRKNEGHLLSPFSEKISKAFTRFML